jgi:hypothetical protein
MSKKKGQYVEKHNLEKMFHRRFQGIVSATHGLTRHGVRAAMAGVVLAVSTAPTWAAGGQLAATQAINAAGTELSGPFAYGASLSMIVAGAVYWYRHHHDMGALGGGLIGTLFVGGVAMGAPTVLRMIPGATGLMI